MRLPPRAVVRGATLQLYTPTASAAEGFRVSQVSGTAWGEYTTTQLNAPALGRRLVTAGRWRRAGWRSVDLPYGAVRAGKNSFGLTNPASSLKVFRAREDVYRRPRLVVRYSIEPPPPTTPDVALRKPAIASSMYRAGFEPSRANDGNPATRWSSAFVKNQWWRVDLGGHYDVRRVDLNWERAYASRYLIETSADGRGFTTAADVRTGGPGPKATLFTPRKTRYVRVRGVTRATSSGISFWAARAFGTPSDPPPPPKQCADGRDNDSDSQTDYPGDQGCAAADDDSEAPDAPQCSDRLDNDADGEQNFPTDPGCASAEDDDETDPPPPPKDPVVGAAGDIAASDFRAADTANLLDDVDQVLTLGDNAYPDGTDQQFRDYYEPTWGRHKAKTKPSPGNHEYHSGGSGYYNYFGSLAGEAGKGYYSFDLGSWHVVSLNSASVTQTQVDWLKQDLAAHADDCTLAYWHHPRWNTGTKGNNSTVAPLWNELYDAGADVLLAGHDHNYQRHASRDKAGAIDAAYGVRQFTVGTGGAGFYDINPSDTETFNDTTQGVIKLTLHDGSYGWRFVPVAGGTYTDTGSGQCHGKPGSSPSQTSENLAPEQLSRVVDE